MHKDFLEACAVEHFEIGNAGLGQGGVRRQFELAAAGCRWTANALDCHQLQVHVHVGFAWPACLWMHARLRYCR